MEPKILRLVYIKQQLGSEVMILYVWVAESWVISECSSYKISNRPCHTLPYIAIALPQWGHNTGIWIHSDCNQLNRNPQLLEFRREILSRRMKDFLRNCTILENGNGDKKYRNDPAFVWWYQCNFHIRLVSRVRDMVSAEEMGRHFTGEEVNIKDYILLDCISVNLTRCEPIYIYFKWDVEL